MFDVALTDESWNLAEKRGELVVGYCAQNPSLELRNANTAEFERLDLDLWKTATELLGVKVRFVDAEWQGLPGGLREGG